MFAISNYVRLGKNLTILLKSTNVITQGQSTNENIRSDIKNIVGKHISNVILADFSWVVGLGL